MPHWSCTRRATTPVTTSRTSTGPWSETGWPSNSAQMPERAPKFTAHEMARRWSLARDLMRRHDLGALVVFGTSGVNRHNQANVFWLTNHLDLHHTYLVAPCEGSVEPVLYVGLLNYVPAARATSAVPAAGGGHAAASSAAARLPALRVRRGPARPGAAHATLGLVTPYQHH